MDVKFSAEQEMLRESARGLLEKECPMAVVRAQLESETGLPEALWQRMAELGWLGLIVPEAYGGGELGMIDLALLLEEMGRVLCPGPFVSTAVVGAQAILLGGSEAQREEWLPPLVRGELRIALAQLEAEANWEPAGIQMQAQPESAGFRLDGRKCFVADAPSAHQLLVVARTEPGSGASAQGISLMMVPRDAPGVSIRVLDYAEQSRKLAEVEFDGVRVAADAVIGKPGEAWPLLERLHDHARVALCAELSGSTQRVLELSVAYAKTREQFGQAIGRFQAIQHKCADMLVASEGIRSAAYYSAWALDQGEPDAHASASLAKAYCSEAGVKITGDGIQIHGGLGFTWEQDLHLYFKHARAAEFAYGSPALNRELAARVLLDGPGPAAP